MKRKPMNCKRVRRRITAATASTPCVDLVMPEPQRALRPKIQNDYFRYFFSFSLYFPLAKLHTKIGRQRSRRRRRSRRLCVCFYYFLLLLLSLLFRLAFAQYRQTYDIFHFCESARRTMTLFIVLCSLLRHTTYRQICTRFFSLLLWPHILEDEK